MEKNREPFLSGGEIESSGSFSEIHEIENKPDYIAKIVDLDYEKALDYEDRKKVFESNIALIKDNYSEYFPKFHFVYAEGDKRHSGTPHVFMEKVAPVENLTQLDLLKYTEQLDNFLHDVIITYLKTFDGNFGKALDISTPENYMYGKTSKDNESRLYFIDIYPVFEDSLMDITRKIEIAIDQIMHYDVVDINGQHLEIDKANRKEDYFPKTEPALAELRQKEEEFIKINFPNFPKF